MINEAIGLASMNPIPGKNKIGGLMVNISTDKDLQGKNSWGNYRVMRDITDKYGAEVSNEGKLILVENTDLNDKNIEIYIIKSPFVDEVFNEIVDEINLHEQEKPIRAKSYLYEKFTGHNLYAPDQLDYDPLLEKIELEKLSKRLAGNDIELDKREKKDTYYSLGNPYRASGNQIEDDTSFSPLMASGEIDNEWGD